MLFRPTEPKKNSPEVMSPGKHSQEVVSLFDSMKAILWLGKHCPPSKKDIYAEKLQKLKEQMQELGLTQKEYETYLQQSQTRTLH